MSEPQAPERIYGWRDSQMSIARHYGGLLYQGHVYKIAYCEKGQPLVRGDVLAREAKERRDEIKAKKAQASALQGSLFN